MRHILSRIPPPQPSLAEKAKVSQSASTDGRGESAEDDARSSGNAEGNTVDHQKSPANPFDMRNLKWMWSGLTFGKSSSAKSTAPPTPSLLPARSGTPADKPDGPGAPEVKVTETAVQSQLATIKVEVDSDSLRDAMASENAHSPAARTVSVPPTPSPPPLSLPPAVETTTSELDLGDADEDPVSQTELDEPPAAPEDNTENRSTDGDTIVESPTVLRDDEHASANPLVVEPAPDPRPSPPAYLTGSIHLSDTSSPAQTRRRRLLHATVRSFLIRLLNSSLIMLHYRAETSHLLSSQMRTTGSISRSLAKRLLISSSILRNA